MLVASGFHQEHAHGGKSSSYHLVKDRASWERRGPTRYLKKTQRSNFLQFCRLKSWVRGEPHILTYLLSFDIESASTHNPHGVIAVSAYDSAIVSANFCGRCCDGSRPHIVE